MSLSSYLCSRLHSNHAYLEVFSSDSREVELLLSPQMHILQFQNIKGIDSYKRKKHCGSTNTGRIFIVHFNCRRFNYYGRKLTNQRTLFFPKLQEALVVGRKTLMPSLPFVEYLLALKLATDTLNSV